MHFGVWVCEFPIRENCLTDAATELTDCPSSIELARQIPSRAQRNGPIGCTCPCIHRTSRAPILSAVIARRAECYLSIESSSVPGNACCIGGLTGPDGLQNTALKHNPATFIQFDAMLSSDLRLPRPKVPGIGKCGQCHRCHGRR